MVRGITVPEKRLEDHSDVPRSRFTHKFHFSSFDQVVISTTWHIGDRRRQDLTKHVKMEIQT